MLITLILILSIFVVYWSMHLLALRASVRHYAEYWNNRANKTGQLTYVAFGDSAAQGIGASSPDKSYVGLIAEKLSQTTRKTVRVINMSKSGAKLDDVLNNQLPAYKKLKLDKPDLVTIEIGANDLRAFDKKKFISKFKKIIIELPEGTYISDVPDYGKPESRKYATVSRLMQEEIASRSDLHFVQLGLHTAKQQKIFGTYSYDFFHPNDRGYKIWENAFWEEISNK